MSTHAAIWMDHEQAKVFFLESDLEASFARPKHQLASRMKGRDAHHRGGAHDQKEYFEAVARAVREAAEILVLGPGTAKLEFVKHVQAHEPSLGEHIVGVETADHPTDGQIVAHSKSYFRAKDRMLGTSAR